MSPAQETSATPGALAASRAHAHLVAAHRQLVRFGESLEREPHPLLSVAHSHARDAHIRALTAWLDSVEGAHV